MEGKEEKAMLIYMGIIAAAQFVSAVLVGLACIVYILRGWNMKEEKPEIDEDWANIARISREKWSSENPYEDETSNRLESFTIT